MIVFILLAPALFWIDVLDSSTSTLYWSASSLLAGTYLWCVSGLGYAGAKAYKVGHGQAIASLIAFMVMVIAFLSMFVAATSIVAHCYGWLPMWHNLVTAGGLFVLGVGSYMIEIIYLATECQEQHELPISPVNN